MSAVKEKLGGVFGELADRRRELIYRLGTEPFAAALKDSVTSARHVLQYAMASNREQVYSILGKAAAAEAAHAATFFNTEEELEAIAESARSGQRYGTSGVSLDHVAEYLHSKASAAYEKLNAGGKLDMVIEEAKDKGLIAPNPQGRLAEFIDLYKRYLEEQREVIEKGRPYDPTLKKFATLLSDLTYGERAALNMVAELRELSSDPSIQQYVQQHNVQWINQWRSKHLAELGFSQQQMATIAGLYHMSRTTVMFNSQPLGIANKVVSESVLDFVERSEVSNLAAGARGSEAVKMMSDMGLARAAIKIEDAGLAGARIRDFFKSYIERNGFSDLVAKGAEGDAVRLVAGSEGFKEVAGLTMAAVFFDAGSNASEIQATEAASKVLGGDVEVNGVKYSAAARAFEMIAAGRGSIGNAAARVFGQLAVEPIWGADPEVSAKAEVDYAENYRAFLSTLNVVRSEGGDVLVGYSRMGGMVIVEGNRKWLSHLAAAVSSGPRGVSPLKAKPIAKRLAMGYLEFEDFMELKGAGVFGGAADHINLARMAVVRQADLTSISNYSVYKLYEKYYSEGVGLSRVFLRSLATSNLTGLRQYMHDEDMRRGLEALATVAGTSAANTIKMIELSVKSLTMMSVLSMEAAAEALRAVASLLPFGYMVGFTASAVATASKLAEQVYGVDFAKARAMYVLSRAATEAGYVSEAMKTIIKAD